MTDDISIPPVPVDGQMLPELLSAKLFRLAAVLARGNVNFNSAAVGVAILADEAEALEARVRNGRTKP